MNTHQETIKRLQGKYFVYNTVWTEGDVVAHYSDVGFAVGYDGCTGHVHYVDSLQELVTTHSFNLISTHNKREDTALLNTSHYSRKESPYCHICSRLKGTDDVAHCSVSDCPHLNELDDETN